MGGLRDRRGSVAWAQFKDPADRGILDERARARPHVSDELRVVPEPPGARARDHEVARAQPALEIEPRDCIVTVGWVMACVLTIHRAREMPSGALSQRN